MIVKVDMDDKLATDLTELFDELGMDISTAFLVFAKTVAREKRIPFEIGIHEPNAETLEAMAETERILADPSSTKIYSDVHEMFKEILADEA
ncbi:MAG: type II toxin-antitoxin system RelB/DinJ family antitoxin [Anaerocolumna sp.]